MEQVLKTLDAVYMRLQEIRIISTAENVAVLSDVYSGLRKAYAMCRELGKNAETEEHSDE